MENLDQFTYHLPVRMRWKDIDEFRHVNNAVYLTYLEEVRFRYLEDAYKWDWQQNGIILANVNIDYLYPLTLRDTATIYTRIAEIRNKSFLMEYLIVAEQTNGKILANRATTTMVMFDYKAQKTFPIRKEVRAQFLAYEKPESIIVR